jgi:outer membrane protein W
VNRIILSTLLAMSLAGAVSAAENAASASSESALAGLEIGTRLIHVELQNDKQGRGIQINGDWGGTYLGSINYIDEDQDYAPTRLYLQYFFHDYVGVGVSYDNVEAETAEDRSALGLPNLPGDGNIGVRGPILYVVGRYPNESAFTPFAEIGVAFYNAYFDEDPNWSDGGLRRMDPEDTEALVVAVGCDYALTENLSVNVYLRAVENADVDIAWYRRGDPEPQRSGSFPLDYYGAGVGIKYAFD